LSSSLSLRLLFTAAYELWLKAGSASSLNHDVTTEESMTIMCSDGTDQITSSYKVDISDAVCVDLSRALGKRGLCKFVKCRLRLACAVRLYGIFLFKKSPAINKSCLRGKCCPWSVTVDKTDKSETTLNAHALSPILPQGSSFLYRIHRYSLLHEHRNRKTAWTQCFGVAQCVGPLMCPESSVQYIPKLWTVA